MERCDCGVPMFDAVSRPSAVLIIAAALLSAAWPSVLFPQTRSTTIRVESLPTELDAERPERRTFGSLHLLSAFHLQSKDRRFGGLSGLSIGEDGKLYAISDRGYWLSARMIIGTNGALSNLVNWRLAPILTPARKPVGGKWRDAEALTRAADGSFLVAFEGVHRIWRYPPPPATFASPPTLVPLPRRLSRAPGNGGIEGLCALPDGRLLALTEEFKNPDDSFKGWLLGENLSAELSYIPADGFRVTDCAARDSGDVLVLERRYMPIGILSARVTLVKAASLAPGAKLAGKELVKLEHPLATENFEGIAAHQTPRGTVVFLVSDDNYGWFQNTLLLQFLLPDTNG